MRNRQFIRGNDGAYFAGYEIYLELFRSPTFAIRVWITHYRIRARIRRRSTVRNGLEKRLGSEKPVRYILSLENQKMVSNSPALYVCLTIITIMRNVLRVVRRDVDRNVDRSRFIIIVYCTLYTYFIFFVWR